jgi:hypothetical protein
MDINTNDVVGHGTEECLGVNLLVGLKQALDGPDQKGAAATGDVGEAFI